ncbi:inovirus-type Gp2 protein [Pseudomonas sp. CrR25]|nr:inovirus-type Gp2 protein [Pseudomonas sp. CrR25]
MGEMVDLEECAEIVYTEEGDISRELKSLYKLTRYVVKGKEEFFSIVAWVSGKHRLVASPKGKDILRSLDTWNYLYADYFPLYNLNPYIELFFECISAYKGQWYGVGFRSFSTGEVEWLVPLLNSFVGSMRKKAAEEVFAKNVKRFERAAEKRRMSLDSYIDAEFSKYSRLLVLRLDLAYKRHFVKSIKSPLECVKIAKRHWELMRRNLQGGKPVSDLKGYACKLEYAYETGCHFHLMLFFDGANYREDITLAKLIGLHWANVITGGNGRYFNCNAKKYEKRLVGTFGWHEKERLADLKNYVGGYLAKEDFLRRISPECGRVFFRGVITKLKASGRGRPRRAV